MMKYWLSPLRTPQQSEPQRQWWDKPVPS